MTMITISNTQHNTRQANKIGIIAAIASNAMVL
jgi:hypothetical protein